MFWMPWLEVVLAGSNPGAVIDDLEGTVESRCARRTGVWTFSLACLAAFCSASRQQK
jgi:hypothetical protein